jgi:hypothetical protein
MRFTSLLALLPALVSAADIFGEKTVNPDVEKQRSLNVSLSIEFIDMPQELGVKLVNGNPTKVKVAMTNLEENALFVEALGGSLWDLKQGKAIKTLPNLKVGMSVAHDQQVSSLPLSGVKLVKLVKLGPAEWLMRLLD